MRDQDRLAELKYELENLEGLDPRDLGFEDYDEGLRAIEGRILELQCEIDQLEGVYDV